MTDEKSWRDAKLPKWAMDSIEKEMDAHKLTAALSWPTEARPQPLPFFWTDYDRQIGDPEPGLYWLPAWRSVVRSVEIARHDGSHGQNWKSWMFRIGGATSQWATNVERGRLFESERDARLELLWRECEASAKKLQAIRSKLYS